MEIAFYVAALLAILTTVLALTRTHPVHALLYLVLSLLSVSALFLLLGAPFVAALEVVVYAGAIMVLFVFVVMLLNVGRAVEKQERAQLGAGAWILPIVIGAALFGELAYVLSHAPAGGGLQADVAVKPVATALFGPYLIGVEIAALLLLAGMIGAYHLGRHDEEAQS
jgi:NADH-quinone oxidoreductase subunit J